MAPAAAGWPYSRSMPYIYLSIYRLLHNKNLLLSALHSARIEHHTDLASNSLWWQVLSELGPDDTYTAMGTGDLAPDYAIQATLLHGLCLVNICQSLSEVEVSLPLGLHASNLDQSSVVVLGGLSTLVAQELSCDVKSNTLSSHCGDKYLQQMMNKIVRCIAQRER